MSKFPDQTTALDAVIKDHILKVVAAYKFNYSRAADALAVSRGTIRNILGNKNKAKALAHTRGLIECVKCTGCEK